MTAVLSMATENWDDDFEFHPNPVPPGNPGSSSQNRPLRLSTADSALTEDWDQSPVHESHPETTGATNQPHAGPSTQRTDIQRKTSQSTENWDDDFKFDDKSSPSSSVQEDEPRHDAENWDAEFDGHNDNATFPTDDDDDDDDDDMEELGFNDKEEDRTVTARSRRAALSRLNASSPDASPPPPVPPIPLSLLSPTAEHPFPRSPTASVFSVPTLNSARDSYYHNNSTTHLRPTISRTSIGGFANLPPSPPLHKERERRRLRKKSRPPEPVYELTVRSPLPPPSVNSSSDIIDTLEQTRGRSVSPHTPSPTPPPLELGFANNSNRNSINASIGAASPPSKAPLLSRIGSVKKWGVRKKRASSTPSEVMLQEAEQDRLDDTARLPPPSSSPSKPGWFFRVTSGGGSPSNRLANHQDSGSDLNSHVSTPSPSGSDLPVDTPSKLVKRKSFGFVPIRKNKGPLNDGAPSAPIFPNDLPPDLEAELSVASSTPKKQRPVSQLPEPSQSKHTAYAGLGLGLAKRVPGSTDNLPAEDVRRDRKRSFSRSRSRGPQNDEPEHGKGIIENVRKISLVGRHRRTKSGASLASVGEALRRASGEEAESAETTGLKRPAVPPPIDLSPIPVRVASNSTIRTPASANEDPLSRVTNTPTKAPLSAPKPAASPQSASLGRSSVVPTNTALGNTTNNNTVPRRNSLGDLKIPARISQAQVGLRRDLGMVREFASNVEQLRDLQVVYHSLVTEVQGLLDAHTFPNGQHSSQRPVSPGILNFTTPKANRTRSGTDPSNAKSQAQLNYKDLASIFYTINSRYRITWECAELLIDLGGAPDATPASAPSTSISAPSISAGGSLDTKRGRTLTLTREDSRQPSSSSSSSTASIPASPAPTTSLPTPSTTATSPVNPAWRASTGRHDLNQRQLMLLREMLGNTDPSFVAEDSDVSIPEEAAQSTISVNRDWRWGDAMNSTVTLPSEESSVQGGGSASSTKKKRTSRLAMTGLRDMLRALKSKQSNSTLPVSSESSLDNSNHHHYAHPPVHTYGRRRAKTSSGPESMKSTRERPTSPYNPSSLSAAKASPRRPSLASIFRLGQKSKTNTISSASNSIGDGSTTQDTTHDRASNSTGEDEDWDRLDGAGDLEVASADRDAHATVRGRSPYLMETSLPSTSSVGQVTKRSASASQTSLRMDALGSPRPTRLSNVEENDDDHRTPKPSTTTRTVIVSPSHNRQIPKSGSVRSMPPQPLSEIRLALTPENIKPLLENSREVHARLIECISELRVLSANLGGSGGS